MAAAQPKHTCPVPGCGRGRKLEHLMCAAHWHRVPSAMQKAVWDALRRYLERGADYLPALRAAQQAAIRAVSPSC